ncbi:MAG: DUF1800 domain-containing protein [Bacteroidetes bacterium]|nr:DUF1800 domain-containing protein [Bacteroidota bacterium]MBS1648486.1 DUF1800 domain-containing protein [Bacteroidota bacterium]
MKLQRMFMCFSAGAVLFVFSAFIQLNKNTSKNEKYALHFPYKKMGLTDRQAAAHLISRFTFGSTPTEVDDVVNTGIENWFQQQLDGKLADDDVTQRLSTYDALNLNNEKIIATYPRQSEIIRLAIKEGVINKDSVNKANKAEYRQQVKAFMDKYGYKDPKELQRQLINQKIIRAAYSNNQLHEVLTDFWFNHFNVSLTKEQCAPFILTYERDAIRPNILSNFETLLEATAKHPAMLEYLDNATSVSNDNEIAKRQRNSAAGIRAEQQMEEILNNPNSNPIKKQIAANKKNQGLNENYAREIMELHTLGVDGGYTQKDVTEVARALTGWTLNPNLTFAKQATQKLMSFITWDKMAKQGFVKEGDFFFAANKHDQNEKTILGKKFSAGGGYYEGMEVIKMLAMHPSTAKFICKKLAVRFVSDNPSQALLDNLSKVYLQTKGDIKAIIVAIVNSDEFWSKDALREKIKSPFELTISSIRATNADLQQPFQIFNWCVKMGQKFYYYQAPTGFPDKASYWINTGALLSRMNFGLAFATQKIPGIKINLAALNNNHEPESIDAALVTYSKILLPERNQDENIKRLSQLIKEEDVEKKINDAANANTIVNTDTNTENETTMMMNNKKEEKEERAALNKKSAKPIPTAYVQGNNSTIAQVVGIIIGSPEFQRR